MNRMPVQTYVIERTFQMVKEIIQRELARNGQVFYLYNNVKEIYNGNGNFGCHAGGGNRCCAGR